MIGVNHQVTRGELRKFGLIMGVMIGVWFGLLLPWLFGHAWPLWPWIAGGVVGILGLVVPALLRPVYIGWMYLGLALGWVNSRIILGIVFYLLFTPISVIMHCAGKDPMARRLDSQVESYRKQSATPPDRHMSNPY